MKAPISPHGIRMFAAAALASCTMVMAWSASAVGQKVDPPTFPNAARIAVHQGSLSRPVVMRTVTPSADYNRDPLPIVLSSVALLVAIGGIGFTVLAGARTRRSPQPGA
jgi:hypothetical protein